MTNAEWIVDQIKQSDSLERLEAIALDINADKEGGADYFSVLDAVEKIRIAWKDRVKELTEAIQAPPNDICRCHDLICPLRFTCLRYVKRFTGGPRTPHTHDMFADNQQDGVCRAHMPIPAPNEANSSPTGEPSPVVKADHGVSL